MRMGVLTFVLIVGYARRFGRKLRISISAPVGARLSRANGFHRRI